MKADLKILKNLSEVWMRKSTVRGLVYFGIIINSLYFSFIIFLTTIINNANIIDTPNKVLRFIILILLCLICINVLLFFIWLIWRRVPQISESKIGIIFAPHADDDNQDLIYKLYEQLRLDIKKRNIKQIICKLLPEKKIISNPLEALQLCSQSGARVIIYGNVDRGNINNELVEGFKSISFTVRHRNLLEREKKPVLRDIASSLAYRTFSIKDKNSFIERSIISENIVEVACFFTALGLALDGKIDLAKQILEHLISVVERKLREEKNKPQLRFFYNSVVSCLTFTLASKMLHIYKKYLIDNITDPNFNQYAEQCLVILKKLVRLNQKSSEYYLRSGIIYFHFGKLKLAWESIKKARELCPQNDPAPYFSSAFLCLWTERYKPALKYYIKAEKCKNHDKLMILDILLFLQGLFKIHPEKIQIKFAMAFINEYFFDITIAREDYKSFLEESKDMNTGIVILRDYAEQRLGLMLKKS